MPQTHPPTMIGSRELFETLEARVYLNHSAISPMSSPVRERLMAVTADYAHLGLEAFFKWLPELDVLRQNLGALIGAQAGDIALTPNTSHGVIATAMCLPWEAGQRIVLFEGEFPTNITPWQQAARLYGLEIVWHKVADFMADPEEGLAKLEATLAQGARLVAVSHTQFQNGLAMPVAQMAALCHQFGAEIFVDAIQAVGVVPMDVSASGVDYLTCGSHKWLMGPEGAGFLYVKPGLAQKMRPNMASWLSHEEALTFLSEGPGHLRYDRPVRRSIDFLEGGASNMLGFSALSVSTGMLRQLGVEAIHAHVNAYHDKLEEGLVARGLTSLRSPRPEARSGILSVRGPEGFDLQALWQHLNAQGIACSFPDGHLRFAPSWPNHLDEVTIILEQIPHL